MAHRGSKKFVEAPINQLKKEKGMYSLIPLKEQGVRRVGTIV